MSFRAALRVRVRVRAGSRVDKSWPSVKASSAWHNKKLVRGLQKEGHVQQQTATDSSLGRGFGLLIPFALSSSILSISLQWIRRCVNLFSASLGASYLRCARVLLRLLLRVRICRLSEASIVTIATWSQPEIYSIKLNYPLENQSLPLYEQEVA